MMEKVMKFRKPTTAEKVYRVKALYETLMQKDNLTEREKDFVKRTRKNMMDKNGEIRPFQCSYPTMNKMYRETYRFKMKRVETV